MLRIGKLFIYIIVICSPSDTWFAAVTAKVIVVSAAAAVVPPNPGEVFHRQHKQYKQKVPRKRRVGRPEALLDKERSRLSVSVDLAHPQNAFQKRYKEYARRRIRHMLCAAGSAPFFAQRKSDCNGDERYRDAVKKTRRRPGTLFILQYPTTDMANEMYRHMRVGEEMPFNHDSVGMTKPSRLVPTTAIAAAHPNSRKRGNDGVDAVPASGDYSLDKYSWPDAALSDREAKRCGWRVIRCRKCVGYGAKCYERVRREVLDWEFATVGHEEEVRNESTVRKYEQDRKINTAKAMGIIRAKAASSFNRSSSPPAGRSQRVQSIHLGIGSRCMVTYTECRYGIDIRPRIRIGLPTFYAVNPVASVYDISDKRCSNGEVFTCTAYATVGNHLLSGEERVTVAMRNSSSAIEQLCPVHVEILSYSRPAPSFMGKIVWPLIGRNQKEFFSAEMDHLSCAGKYSERKGMDDDSACSRSKRR